MRMPDLIDYGGVLYKYNRGYIIIEAGGFTLEYSIDHTKYNHCGQVRRTAKDLGYELVSSMSPYDVCCDATRQGLVVILLEGGTAHVYLPETITEKQKKKINENMEPRSNFDIGICYNGEALEDDYDFSGLQGVLEDITSQKSNKI